MRKILLKSFILIFILFFHPVLSQAKIMKVMSLTDISTLKNPSVIELLVIEDFYLTKDFNVEEGSIIIGKMVETENAKSYHRNATFKFSPYILLTPYDEKYFIKYNIPASYKASFDLNVKKIDKSKTKISKKNFSKKTTILSDTDNEKEPVTPSKITSALTEKYKNSISSIQKNGNEIGIITYDLFKLNFKNIKENDKNYQTLLTDLSELSSKYKSSKTNSDNINLQSNYPYKHQIREKIRYLSQPIFKYKTQENN